MKMKKKRRFFTLLETMIALALLSVLIAFLLGFYSEIESIHSELGKVRRENFRLLYIQNRLKEVLSTTSYAFDKKPFLEKKQFVFFTSKDTNAALRENSLVFIYNNGIAHPFFSQNVLGRLYLDGEGRFCLANWPQPQKWVKEGHLLEFSPINKEILLENVASLSFDFYMPPDMENIMVVNPSEIQKGQTVTRPVAGWQKDGEWLITHDVLPALVKVTVVQNPTPVNKQGASHHFIVPLNSFSKPVIYTK